MTDLTEFVITAWVEEVEREEDTTLVEEFVKRFFQDNMLNHDELEDYMVDLFKNMEVNSDRMIKIMLNTIDWNELHNSITAYYDEELKQYHVPKKQSSAEEEFFAIIDKEMKQLSVS